MCFMIKIEGYLFLEGNFIKGRFIENLIRSLARIYISQDINIQYLQRHLLRMNRCLSWLWGQNTAADRMMSFFGLPNSKSNLVLQQPSGHARILRVYCCSKIESVWILASSRLPTLQHGLYRAVDATYMHVCLCKRTFSCIQLLVYMLSCRIVENWRTFTVKVSCSSAMLPGSMDNTSYDKSKFDFQNWRRVFCRFS